MTCSSGKGGLASVVVRDVDLIFMLGDFKVLDQVPVLLAFVICVPDGICFFF